jgi:hypothetical protein
LAAASYNASAPSTPRLDSDASIGAVLGDGSVALVFAQATHYRDVQVCGRTQVSPGASYRGTEGFDHAHNGYCCYWNTQSAATSYLQLKRGGLPLARGDTVTTGAVGGSVWRTLTLDLEGGAVGCTLTNSTGAILASLSFADDDDESLAHASGGVAAMVLYGDSGHRFLSLAVRDESEREERDREQRKAAAVTHSPYPS